MVILAVAGSLSCSKRTEDACPASRPAVHKISLGPGPIVRELVGPQIIDFESSATRYAPGQVSAFKKKYSDFVTTAVKTIRDAGYKEPENRNELLKLCRAVTQIVWSKFTPQEIILLADGVARDALDCDISSLVFADILNQFGVDSKLVMLPLHVILHMAGSIYVETTPQAHGAYYSSEEKFNNAYPISYGECDFQTENSVNYYNRGNARVDSRDYTGAIRDYTEVIKRNPKHADAYTGRGNAKAGLEDYAGAIKEYSESIKRNPKYAEAYAGRGVARFKTGDSDGAIEDFDKSIGLKEEYADAYSDRSAARFKLRNYAGALEDADQAIKRKPEFVEAYGNRGNARIMLTNYAGAIEDFDKVIGLNPKLAGAYNGRGLAKKMLGDILGATSDFEMAKRLKDSGAAR